MSIDYKRSKLVKLREVHDSHSHRCAAATARLDNTMAYAPTAAVYRNQERPGGKQNKRLTRAVCPHMPPHTGADVLHHFSRRNGCMSCATMVRLSVVVAYGDV